MKRPLAVLLAALLCLITSRPAAGSPPAHRDTIDTWKSVVQRVNTDMQDSLPASKKDLKDLYIDALTGIGPKNNRFKSSDRFRAVLYNVNPFVFSYTLSANQYNVEEPSVSDIFGLLSGTFEFKANPQFAGPLPGTECRGELARLLSADLPKLVSDSLESLEETAIVVGDLKEDSLPMLADQTITGFRARRIVLTYYEWLVTYREQLARLAKTVAATPGLKDKLDAVSKAREENECVPTGAQKSRLSEMAYLTTLPAVGDSARATLRRFSPLTKAENYYMVALIDQATGAREVEIKADRTRTPKDTLDCDIFPDKKPPLGLPCLSRDEENATPAPKHKTRADTTLLFTRFAVERRIVAPIDTGGGGKKTKKTDPPPATPDPGTTQTDKTQSSEEVADFWIYMGYPRLRLSAGLAEAALSQAKFAAQSQAARNSTGTADTTVKVIAVSDAENHKFTPMVFVNVNAIDFRTYPGGSLVNNLNVVLGTFPKSLAGSGLDYFAGFGLGLLDDRAILSYGWYRASQSQLAAGYAPGDRVIDSVPLASRIVWRRAATLGFVIPLSKSKRDPATPP